MRAGRDVAKWPWLLAAALLAGCLQSPAVGFCEPYALASGRLVNAWEAVGLPVDDVAPAWPAAVDDAGYPGSIHSVVWRPDGQAVSAQDVSGLVMSVEGSDYASPVVYRLGSDVVDGESVAVVRATYDKDVPLANVTSDVRRFLELLGGPADMAAFVEGFAASAPPLALGPTVCDLDRGGCIQPPLVANEFKLAWTGPDPVQTLLRHTAVDWQGADALAGPLGFGGAYATKSLHGHHMNTTRYTVVLASNGGVSADAYGPGLNATLAAVLAANSLDVEGLKVDESTCP